MLFLVSIFLGLIVLLFVIIFLAVAFYHLIQYSLPAKSFKKPAAFLIGAALTLILISGGIFLSIPWENI
ncbi:hypothetical protein KJ853_02410 [Patescibacteria group bacterium]|nr:hypothetical protein [Patescibacteria group bacterium]